MTLAKMQRRLTFAALCLLGCGARTGLESGPPRDAGVPADASIQTAAPCPRGRSSDAYLWGENSTLFRFDPVRIEAHRLGRVSCPTAASSWTLSVSRTGVAYLMYEDWHIYRLDLTTLACEPTSYEPNQLGLGAKTALAVSRDVGAERLYVYGQTSDGRMLLAVADLPSFELHEVATITSHPNGQIPDVQADLTGHLVVLSDGGDVLQLDAETGRVIRAQHSSQFDGTVSWAVLTWNSDILFFGGKTVGRYDLDRNALRTVGHLHVDVVGASAAPCIH